MLLFTSMFNLNQSKITLLQDKCFHSMSVSIFIQFYNSGIKIYNTMKKNKNYSQHNILSWHHKSQLLDFH